MTEVDFGQLARDVANLKDRLEIQDVVHRLARGHDRCDSGLMKATFHDGCIDA